MVENFYSVLAVFLNLQRHRALREIFFIRVSSDIYPLQKIKGFSDLVPLCKMHNSYYDTGKLGVTFGHYSSDASNYSLKIQANFFKKFLKEFISVYNYSNSILYQLLCY